MLRLIRPFLVAVVLAIPALSNAADVTWTGSSDDLWDTAANWSPTGAPTSADTAIFGAVPTSNMTVELSQPSYTLTSLVFQDSGFFLQETGTATLTTLTITGGLISSDSAQSASNVVVPNLIEMTAVDNTIIVSGTADHQLELGDLNVTGTGTFTTNIDASLCLAGTTNVTGAFVKTGTGSVCADGILTARSTTVQNGLLMFDSNNSSSLGNVVVSSAGTLSIMSSDDTVSAGTVTTAGVLEVGQVANNGETLIATGGVTVQNGGRLTGLGTVRGNVTVEAGGRIAAGSEFDSGTLTIEGDVDFKINSIALFTITSPNVLKNSLSITGNLTLAGLLSMDDTAAVGLYTLIEFTGDLTGTFAGLVDTVDGYNYNIIYNANSVQVSVTAVPEPSSLALIALAGTAVVILRVRRGAKVAL